MKNLLIRSNAKINICLGLKGKREDGYHDLDMVMLPITLHDSLLITELKNASDNFVTVDDFTKGEIKYNVVTNALNELENLRHHGKKFRIFIHKNVPLQGGLGGGSSNGAFTFKGIDKYLKLNLTREEELSMCDALGSDVAFFVDNKPARCVGRGNETTPITVKNNYYCLIIKPDTGCPTKQVYEISDSTKFETGNVDDVIKALETGDDDLLAKSIFNDLQPAALQICPEIKDIIDELKSAGLPISMMTGSGSSVFAMSTNKRLIKKVARQFEDRYFVEVCSVIK